MRKTLDFNAIERPVLEITLKDTERTKLSLVTPTEALIEKLQANSSAITESVQEGTAESIQAVFILMADFINCNLENVTVTAEELRDKYRMRLEDAVIFFGAYMDFIEEIKTAKN
jgi:hypothetical protein